MPYLMILLPLRLHKESSISFMTRDNRLMMKVPPYVVISSVFQIFFFMQVNVLY